MVLAWRLTGQSVMDSNRCIASKHCKLLRCSVLSWIGNCKKAHQKDCASPHQLVVQ